MRASTRSALYPRDPQTPRIEPWRVNAEHENHAQPTVPIDRRAPLAAPSAASSPAAQASPIVINIYPQAGQDPHAIARAVEAALDRRERAKQSRIGSRLSD